jgi:hypothetical protein
LLAATDELGAPDDRTILFRLKRPFPRLPEALAGLASVTPEAADFVMGERSAYHRFTGDGSDTGRCQHFSFSLTTVTKGRFRCPRPVVLVKARGVEVW